MKKDIFENAYFGKAYKTRDGRKAIFQTTYPSQIDSSKTVYSFFTKDSGFHVNEDGKMDFKIDDDVFSFHECHPECDIVSEWKEEIDEKELDGLVKKYIKNSDFNNDTEEYYRMSWIEEEAFKAGYRKGWEDKK